MYLSQEIQRKFRQFQTPGIDQDIKSHSHAHLQFKYWEFKIIYLSMRS